MVTYRTDFECFLASVYMSAYFTYPLFFFIAFIFMSTFKTFKKFLDKNKGMNKSLIQGAQVVENRLIYVPVWTAKVKADSWYKGYKTVQVPVQRQETYRDSEGNTQTRTVTEYETGYVPVQDEIHTDTNEPMLARKGAAIYGLEEYLAEIDTGKAEPYDFNKIKDLEPEMLNAEIGQEEFEKAVHGRVSDRHRSQAGHQDNPGQI